MVLLLTGLAVFFAVHLLPAFPRLRSGLRRRIGEMPYKGAFTAVALAGFAMIVLGKGQSPFVALWNPPHWGAAAARVLMPLSMLLLAAAYLPSNIKRVTRHPMLWAVTVWALAHLLANGDAASVLLFGSFLAYSLFDMWSAGNRLAHAAAAQRSLVSDVLVVAVALTAYVAVALFHARLFGPPAFT